MSVKFQQPLLILSIIWSVPRLGIAQEVQWFSHGLRSVEVDAPDSKHKSKLSAQDCRVCHQEIYKDWHGSGHANAWTSPLFQEGYAIDHRPDRCLYCHTPLKEQFLEVKQEVSKPRLIQEGVNCATCHVREGRIFSGKKEPGKMHRAASLPMLREAKFCAGCHQFKFSKQLEGGVTTQALAAQNTYVEWMDYQKRGGGKTCQECHMPGGRHVFLGSHDLEFLTSSVTVRFEKRGNECWFFIKPVGVGHRWPTGDVFRHITFEVKAREAKDFKVVESIGRSWATVFDKKINRHIQKMVKDTTLDSFEERVVKVSIAPPFEYRLRYHYTSQFIERKSRLREEQLVVTLHSGSAL